MKWYVSNEHIPSKNSEVKILTHMIGLKRQIWFVLVVSFKLRSQHIQSVQSLVDKFSSEKLFPNDSNA